MLTNFRLDRLQSGRDKPFIDTIFNAALTGHRPHTDLALRIPVYIIHFILPVISKSHFPARSFTRVWETNTNLRLSLLGAATVYHMVQWLVLCWSTHTLTSQGSLSLAVFWSVWLIWMLCLPSGDVSTFEPSNTGPNIYRPSVNHLKYQNLFDSSPFSPSFSCDDGQEDDRY